MCAQDSGSLCRDTAKDIIKSPPFPRVIEPSSLAAIEFTRSPTSVTLQTNYLSSSADCDTTRLCDLR